MTAGIYGTGAAVVSILAVREAFLGDPAALLFWLFAAGLWAATGWEVDHG